MLMSVAAVCDEIGLSRSTLYEELRSGRLSSVRVGSRRLVRRTDLDAWVEELPAGEEVWK